MEEESGGEDARDVAEPYSPPSPSVGVDEARLSQCDRAECGGEAVCSSVHQGSSVASPHFGSDVDVLKLATLESVPDVTYAGDGDGEAASLEVKEADDSPIFLRGQVAEHDEAEVSLPQGFPVGSSCCSDGGFEKVIAFEPDAGDLLKEEVLHMAAEETKSTLIPQWQQGKDSLKQEVSSSLGSPAVSPSGSDGVLLKFASFETDATATIAGEDGAVEEANMDVDSVQVPLQHHEKDGVQEEVLMLPCSSDVGLLKFAASETVISANTANDDVALEEAVTQMDVDGVLSFACKQAENCGGEDISMPKSPVALSPSVSKERLEKVAAFEPDSLATAGDDDAVKEDDTVKEEVSLVDADKLDNVPLPLYEQIVDVGGQELTMPQVSLAEFPSVSDREDENIAKIEHDASTMSHGSADVIDDEPAQKDAKTDGTSVVEQRGGGRRKRGRPPKAQGQAARTLSRRKEEEEVCFICFDGGDLVVCDRRGCPKVYHPSCVNRDEAFFRAKGRWTCGWHICSSCERSAHHMCFTCTHALCRGCIKESGFFCVRGNKGFCQTCMSTVMLIETNEHGNEKMIRVDFDDKSSFEYLFKDYWLELKAKLSLTLEELTRAKNLTKKSDLATEKEDSSDDLHNAKQAQVSSSESSPEHKESLSSRRKIRKRSRNTVNEEGSVKVVENDGTSVSRDSNWASDELLEFVLHMKNGDRTVLSQFDVQGLLLEYIKTNKLRDPRRKSQIVCDSRLQNLFGKQRVGHFEMLKLLESHFLLKDVSPLDTEDKQGGVVDPDPDTDQTNARTSDISLKIMPDKRRKTRKKVEKELLNDLDDYAAIDVHNISLMYLCRNLMEELVDDISFEEKVIGSFVRIRISGVGQRQDLYRLVQVVGTSRAAERYKSGKKTTDVTLEILNLNKEEVIPIDIISNQEFTEEECKRLRQSIKCGFIGRLTVGDVQEKAGSLQAVRINDWLESEKLRLGHLRDRASEKGRRKELRECVEKLQLLNTPEERNRRLNEVPEIHTDPHMDPDYESAEEEESDIRKQDYYNRSRGSSFVRNGKEVKSPGKGGSILSASWSGLRKNSNTWESNRSTLIEGASITDSSSGRGVNTIEFSLNQANDVCQASSSEASKNHGIASSSDASLYNEKVIRSEQLADGAQGNKKPSLPGGLAAIANESDKIWHYQDPSGKVQGPFSIIQLRKWNTTGYFPRNLKIWRTSEKQEDSILLSDALVGQFEKDLPEWEPHNNSTSQSATNLEGIQRGSINIALSNSKNDAQKHKFGENEKWDTRDSSNVSIPTAQPSSKCWLIAEGSINKHLSSSASLQTTTSASVSTSRGREELQCSLMINESSRSSSHSLRELDACSGQVVLGQNVILDGAKSHSASRSTTDTVFLGQTIALTQHPDKIDDLGNFHKKNSELESSSASENQTAPELPLREEMNRPSYVMDSGGSSSTKIRAGLCSNQSLEMKMILSHRPAASGILSSEHDQLSSSQSDDRQDHLFVLHGQHDPDKELLRVHDRSSDETTRKSDGSGRNSDFVACAQRGTSVSSVCFHPERLSFQLETSDPSKDPKENTHVTEVENLAPAASSKIFRVDSMRNSAPLAVSVDNQLHQTLTIPYPGSNLVPEVSSEAPDLSAHPSNAAANLFVQSISAQRSQTSAAPTPEPHKPGHEPMHSATHTKSSNKSTPSVPHMTPNGWNTATDSAIGNNTHSLPSDGSNTLSSSHFGVNATLVPVQQTQLGFDTGSSVQNTGFAVAAQNPNLNLGPVQGTGNMNWTPVPQGNLNAGWGMVAHGSMNMPCGQSAQTIANLSMGLGAQNQVNTMMNTGWVAPARGNTNMNVAWVSPVVGNTKQPSGWGGQSQGNLTANPVWTMLLPGHHTNPSPGWVAPAPSNANRSWETPAQGTMNTDASWGSQQGNINPCWVPSAGNSQSSSTRPPQSGSRRLGRCDNLQGNDSGQAKQRPSWNRMQSGGGSSLPPRGQTGICKFHEMGHCKKGASCNYFHP
ncbi:zinc finger CCCH domain-containing protein 19 [Musa acuminata AAA Group]|uniref:zinc finger CCCH domain-containing protein 19 n=1 Tax=Musa acuminata AAA Group TaxID=214697 RepID=UPI0031D387BC